MTVEGPPVCVHRTLPSPRCCHYVPEVRQFADVRAQAKAPVPQPRSPRPGRGAPCRGRRSPGGDREAGCHQTRSRGGSAELPRRRDCFMFRFLPPRESRRLPGRGGRRAPSADCVPGPRAAHSQPASWSPPHSPRSPWLSPPASPSPSSLSSDFPLARPSSMTPRPVALTAGHGWEAGGHPPWPSEAQMLPTQNGPVLPSSPVSPVGTHPRDGAAAAGAVRTTWLDEARVTTSTANGEGLSESGLADMNSAGCPEAGKATGVTATEGTGRASACSLTF